MKNVPDIIQRGHRLEELLKAREEARAEEARNALREEQQRKPFVEQDLDGAVGGTDAVTEQSSAHLDSLASRLSSLRANGAADVRKRMTLTGAPGMGLTQLNDGGFVAEHGSSATSQPPSAPDSPRHAHMQPSLGLASPQLERSGFAGISDGHTVGPDMQPTYLAGTSEFNKSYPTLDDFESQHPQPDMPIRPLPTPPAKASSSSRPPMPIPSKREVTVEELFPMLHPGFETVSDAKMGQRMVRRQAPRVLLIDVRPRKDWERARINGVDTINLDPSTMQPGLTSDSIFDSLRKTASSAEQQMFASRSSYDAIVLCDRDGRGSSNGLLDPLYRALMEDETRRSSEQTPMVLAGGIDRWARKVGDAGMLVADSASMTPSPGVSESARATQDSPNGGMNGDARSKRQAMYISSPPPSLIPGNPAGSSSINGRSLSNGGYGSGLDIADGPSMPARTYQTAGSAAPSGLPTTSVHAKQPHIPMYAASGSSGSFDYPQLNLQQQQNNRPSYNNMSVHTPAPPPAAMASSGLGMRSPSHDMGGHAQSLDVSRRPPIPSPYTGGPLASAAARQYHSGYRPTPKMENNVRIGMTGLKNMGNSCYMNSSLQCLSATIPLARFLLDGSYKKAINRVNPLGTQGALAEAFAQLIRVMWSEQYTFVSPVTFREAITRFAPAFRGCDQHDAQEFLAFLLDGLHEDLNYVKQKPPPVEMTAERERELETLPQQIASVKEWAIYRERNDSLIVDWFQGQFRNKLTCLTCGKTSTTYNAFLYLSLPIPPAPRGGGAKVTLAQCLDAFTRDEILDKADAWHCPRCNKPRRATKKLTISRLPQVLLIHLKRFSFKGPFTDKIETNVTFPTSNLDLTNYMPPPLPPGAVPKGMPVSASQQPPYVYDLYGATHHFGSLSGGHYTATIRTQGENGEPQWMYCDDSRITKSDDRQIHTPSTYILWWHRKGR